MSQLSQALAAFKSAMGEAPALCCNGLESTNPATPQAVKPKLQIAVSAEQRKVARGRRDAARTNGPVSVQQVAMAALPHQRLYDAETVALFFSKLSRGQRVKDIVLPLGYWNHDKTDAIEGGVEYDEMPDWDGPVLDLPSNWGDIYCEATREASRIRMEAVASFAVPPERYSSTGRIAAGAKYPTNPPVADSPVWPTPASREMWVLG